MVQQNSRPLLEEGGDEEIVLDIFVRSESNLLSRLVFEFTGLYLYFVEVVCPIGGLGFSWVSINPVFRVVFN